jgi:hypothetical protein
MSDERLPLVVLDLRRLTTLEGRVAATPLASQISRYTPLRDDKTELLKLAVNPRSSPILILLRQSSNQGTNFLGDLRSSA